MRQYIFSYRRQVEAFLLTLKTRPFKLLVDSGSSVWEPHVQGEKFPAGVFNSLWNQRATGAKYLINPAPAVLPTAYAGSLTTTSRHSCRIYAKMNCPHSLL